jgi:hypothetical protein
MDGLSSEHYLYADDRVYVLFALLFNSMIVHGFMPTKMMDSLIIPLLKDKKGYISDKDNYLPIVVTCTSSKVLEILVLNRYRASHSTESCAFVLEETINYFNSDSSLIYVCYLDASKAFDRVKLFCICLRNCYQGISLPY